MILKGWLFVGGVAAIATYVALTTSEDDLGIMFGLIGLLSWALWSFQSLYVITISAGVAFEYGYPALAVWGLALAVANGYVVLNGPIALVDQRQRARQEVQE